MCCDTADTCCGSVLPHVLGHKNQMIWANDFFSIWKISPTARWGFANIILFFLSFRIIPSYLFLEPRSYHIKVNIIFDSNLFYYIWYRKVRVGLQKKNNVMRMLLDRPIIRYFARYSQFPFFCWWYYICYTFSRNRDFKLFETNQAWMISNYCISRSDQ